MQGFLADYVDKLNMQLVVEFLFLGKNHSSKLISLKYKHIIKLYPLILNVGDYKINKDAAHIVTDMLEHFADLWEIDFK